MRRYVVSLICCAVVIFLFTSSSFATAAVTRPVPLKSDEVAQGFSLETVEGRRVALEDYKGKKIILFFFTTWCRYCGATLSALQKKKARLEEDGIVLLAIDVGESQPKVASFRKKRKITFDILLDESMAVTQKYRVIGVPTFFLVGTNGIVIYEGNDLPRNYREIFSKEDLYTKD